MSSDRVDDGVAIVDEVFDVEESCRPFGKRWLAQSVKLTTEQLAALHVGKYLAINVNDEYVVFLHLDTQGE